MEAKLRRRQIGGFLFTSILGTLLHFLYEWSGDSPLLGLVSAVNESTWEHMKLLFVPMFLFALWESTAFASRYHCFWRVKLLGIVVGLLLIPTLYYTYTGALGLQVTWLNILIFYIAAAAAYALETRLLLRQQKCSGMWELPAALLVWGVAFAFLFFTYLPPRLPIFRDPVTLSYGIQKYF